MAEEEIFVERRGRKRGVLWPVVRLLGDGWDVVFCGKDSGEISGGGWKPRRREKKEREGWLQENRAGKADFIPILSSLLPTVSA